MSIKVIGKGKVSGNPAKRTIASGKGKQSAIPSNNHVVTAAELKIRAETRKENSAKGMLTMPQACVAVMSTKKPLTASQVWHATQEKELCASNGKTPVATVYSILLRNCGIGNQGKETPTMKKTENGFLLLKK
jgi:hypothetical protein